jgi:nucleoside-diphosphate-sugar epimerase
MKVAITGWDGFLSTKLRNTTDIEWVEYPNKSDVLLHLGSPTFTEDELNQHDAQIMHQYVRETIKIVDRFTGHIIFASTTGVDDIKLDHTGSTSYNLSKLYLENYIINNCDSSAVLRIGTVVSNDLNDINLRDLIYRSRIKAIENELTPFGFIADGQGSEEKPLLNF